MIVSTVAIKNLACMHDLEYEKKGGSWFAAELCELILLFTSGFKQVSPLT